MKTPPFLSIVIPLYNEEKRLRTFSKIYSFFRRQNYSTEIILVDDGSIDNTLSKIKRLQKKYRNIKIIHYSINKGKGNAIREGMRHALGKYHMFMDIDLSTPLTTIISILPLIKEYDVISGTRKKKGAQVIQHQPFVREKLGVLFTSISQHILGLSITDFTCGFKCFSKKASHIIFKRSLINRWGFDCEIFVIAKQHNLLVYEHPVTWKNEGGTKVKFPQDIINSISDLLIIRKNLKNGSYKKRL